MKKLLFVLLCTLLTMGSFAQTPIFTGPTLTAFRMPKDSDTVVWYPLKTSAYSYNKVPFRIGASTVPQNLYVYSWNNENWFRGGIAWIRRDTLDNVVDTGWIVTPSRMQCINVGIVQDTLRNTYVIASYFDAGTTGIPPGFRYSTYQWNPTGLTSLPLSYSLTNDTAYGDRISMDCYDLKKVVFTWDQWSDTVSGVYRPGGIHVRAMNITTGIPPFNMNMGLEKYIEGTDSLGVVPDVAIGYSGDSVHVAYIRRDTPHVGAKPIIVKKAHFNEIRLLAGSSIDMPVEDSIPAATLLYNGGGVIDRYGDFHINIDCPDHYARDVWSMIYAYDTADLYAETKTTTGTFANTLLTNYLTTANRWPAVVYSNTANAINYGWWSRRGGGYIATKLSNNGTTFFTGTPLGTYKVIDYITGVPYKKLSFSKQNDRTNRLFAVYPWVQSGIGPYFDLRSKLANWTTTSFRPENPTNTDDLSIDDVRLEVAPNPFGQSFQLLSDAPSNETFDVVITDIQGKTVHAAKGNLVDINRSFEVFGTQAASGMYFISTHSSSKNYDRLIKIVKK